MKLGEVAQALGASLEGGSEDVEISGVATLEDAVPGQITFLADRRHEALVAGTTASAILLAPGAPAASIPVLRVENPYAAFAQALELFHPPRRPPAGIHPMAVIAPTAVLGDGASVGPHVVVGGGALTEAMERAEYGLDGIGCTEVPLEFVESEFDAIAVLCLGDAVAQEY